MKTLKSFIKESISDMLTFKDGHLDDSSKSLPVSNRDKLTALETIACKQLFKKEKPGNLSYDYHYESVGHPEGVIVSCSKSNKKYLISHHGYIQEFFG